MGIFKAFDRSPEAMAAGLDQLRRQLEPQVGQPIPLFLASLAAPGAIEGAISGWGVSRKGHQVTGGATDRKNHFGLLAVTGDGWLRLYKTKAARQGVKVVEEVRAWPPGHARVAFHRSWPRVWVYVDGGGDDQLAFELIVDQAVMDHCVQPFAAHLGVTVEGT